MDAVSHLSSFPVSGLCSTILFPWLGLQHALADNHLYPCLMVSQDWQVMPILPCCFLRPGKLRPGLLVIVAGER